MTSIADNLANIHQEIVTLEQQFARAPHSVQLLAVSKNQSPDKIRAAIAAGQFAFGENYLQEALLKMKELNDPNLEWHFIGHIQRNKTQAIAEHFAWAHTVDNILIAERFSKQRSVNLPPLNICIQVNISEEETKSGIKKTEVHELAAKITRLPNLKLRGLMTIPAPQTDFKKQRAQFHELALLYQALREEFALDTLSMGMSDDFAAAIAEGATIIRLGSAIFGARNK